MRTHQHHSPGRQNCPRTAASSAASQYEIQQNSASTTAKQKLTRAADKTNTTHLFSSPAGPPSTSPESPSPRAASCSPLGRQTPPFVPDRAPAPAYRLQGLTRPQPSPMPPPHLWTTKAHGPLSSLPAGALCALYRDSCPRLAVRARLSPPARPKTPELRWHGLTPHQPPPSPPPAHLQPTKAVELLTGLPEAAPAPPRQPQ